MSNKHLERRIWLREKLVWMVCVSWWRRRIWSRADVKPSLEQMAQHDVKEGLLRWGKVFVDLNANVSLSINLCEREAWTCNAPLPAMASSRSLIVQQLPTDAFNQAMQHDLAEPSQSSLLDDFNHYKPCSASSSFYDTICFTKHTTPTWLKQTICY